jgi:stage II sporulation protein D
LRGCDDSGWRRAALTASACLTLLWTRAALADDASLRVLLLEAADSATVDGVVVTPQGMGLRAGQRVLGAAWSPRRNGTPHSVDGLRVHGAVRVERAGAGLRVVNRVGLEDYVAGTLGREIYPSWLAETLKAQAVVTRTYALYRAERRRDAPYDLVAHTADQVYGGIDAETPSVRAAVRATAGEILVFEGSPILAAFHSASGGRTASAEEVWGEALPYLVSRPVPDEEDSPDTYWRASVSGTTLGRALAPLGLRLGAVREIRVAERSASGRALVLDLRGSEGRGRLEARALRTALGASVVRSTLFEVRTGEDGFIFVGSGHGHGVGMSQWGAQAMAVRGADYREILEAFYPGTQLVGGAGR